MHAFFCTDWSLLLTKDVCLCVCAWVRCELQRVFYLVSSWCQSPRWREKCKKKNVMWPTLKKCLQDPYVVWCFLFTPLVQRLSWCRSPRGKKKKREKKCDGRWHHFFFYPFVCVGCLMGVLLKSDRFPGFPSVPVLLSFGLLWPQLYRAWWHVFTTYVLELWSFHQT